MTTYWSSLKTTDFANVDTQKSIAILPVGAIEQHGPHLPLGVDAFLAEQFMSRLVSIAPDLSAYILPTISFGFSPEHSAFAGTLSLSSQTVIALWTEVAESVLRSGIHKLLFFNTHGGHAGIPEIVGRPLRSQHQALVYSTNWWDLIPKDMLAKYISTKEQRYGIHAGQLETAVMLYLAKDQVDTKAAKNFVSSAQERDLHYRTVGQGISKMSWLVEDYHPEGAVGDATLATSEQGKVLFDSALQSLVQLLGEISTVEHESPIANTKENLNK
jgi:creatinine amidohydrolase